MCILIYVHNWCIVLKWYLETDTFKKVNGAFHWDSFIPTSLAIIKKKTVSLGEDMEKLEPLYTAAENIR